MTQGYNLLLTCLLQNLSILESMVTGLGAEVPERTVNLFGLTPNVRAMAVRFRELCQAFGPASASFGDACAKSAWKDVLMWLNSVGCRDLHLLLGDAVLLDHGTQERNELVSRVQPAS